MQYPKRLIEVDLPIRRISAHARREKSIRHGHISTLHIWWARRPLAACRAVICASLWPDPVDPLCPPAFRQAAAKEIAAFAKAVHKSNDISAICDNESWKRYGELAKNDKLKLSDPADLLRLRNLLLDFIADFSAWEASTQPQFLQTARHLTQAAHEALGGAPGTRPLVVDPFAGGGAIPLEALRVGADAFASDLNPVAVLLNKVVLEYIPKYGQKLADEVQKWGQWIKEQAEKELAEFYPKDPDGATPIAYLWARTITCEGPACGAEVPLMRSLWIAKKGSRSTALCIVPRPRAKRIDFEIIQNAKASDVGNGTVARGSVTCPCCGFTTAVKSVRIQLKTRKGGAADARLYAVATTRSDSTGRFYRLPTERDVAAAQRAAARLKANELAHEGRISLVPHEQLPLMSGVFNAPIYGHDTWGSLFAPRQLLAITTLSRLTKEAGAKLLKENESDLADAVQTCLALAVDKQADLANSLCAWEPIAQCPRHLFGRQAIGMVWDFAEGVPTGESSGSWAIQIERTAHILKEIGNDWLQGHIAAASATGHPLPDDTASAFITDPPYYNAVPYADLSDFFYVWLRRTLPASLLPAFSSDLSPKKEEICQMSGWDPVRYSEKDGGWFESKMSKAMAEGRRITQDDGIGVVVFAHKSTAGWEAQLQAMVDAGWIMTGSWPIDTEMGSRLRAMDSAALASSVHLVCRPRANGNTGSIGDWRDVLTELPKRIHAWLPRLAEEGVVGADAIFACLGPALEVFSRYTRVEKASGERVTLREYLEHVWAVVAQEALRLVFEGADATGFEEDARLTAMWLWTLSAGASDKQDEDEDEETDDDDESASGKGKAKPGYSLEYDAARKIAQGLGGHLEQLTSVVEVKGDKARLLSVSERTRHLFGKDDAEAPKAKGKKKTKQMALQYSIEDVEEETGGWGAKSVPKLGTTSLDRVHQCMILFAAGRSEAVKRFLVEEGVGRDVRFWKLAQSLSALYPAGTDEKRWVDGVLARKKGLGF